MGLCPIERSGIISNIIYSEQSFVILFKYVNIIELYQKQKNGPRKHYFEIQVQPRPRHNETRSLLALTRQPVALWIHTKMSVIKMRNFTLENVYGKNKCCGFCGQCEGNCFRNSLTLLSTNKVSVTNLSGFTKITRGNYSRVSIVLNNNPLHRIVGILIRILELLEHSFVTTLGVSDTKPCSPFHLQDKAN